MNKKATEALQVLLQRLVTDNVQVDTLDVSIRADSEENGKFAFTTYTAELLRDSEGTWNIQEIVAVTEHYTI